MTYTKQQIIDSAFTAGIAEDKALEFFYYYDAQGWVFGNGLPIVNLGSALVRWRNNQYRFDRKTKTKLFPIAGKTCSMPRCKMPAVYKDTSGQYDSYKCRNHLPVSVREEYE